jgi:hypothetical protein
MGGNPAVLCAAGMLTRIAPIRPARDGARKHYLPPCAEPRLSSVTPQLRLRVAQVHHQINPCDLQPPFVDFQTHAMFAYYFVMLEASLTMLRDHVHVVKQALN